MTTWRNGDSYIEFPCEPEPWDEDDFLWEDASMLRDSTGEPIEVPAGEGE